MKSNNYFPGAELEGVIIEFYTPNEFYCSFIEENDYIKLSETGADDCTDAPERNEVVKLKKFMIRVGDENVLCEVINDLKNDDVSCQVLLCNTSVKLKVNYQSLRNLNDKINNDDIVALKLNDFAPIFQHSWSNELLMKMKEKVLYQRCIVQFKSSIPDPADGRYPINLIDVSNGKSVTDQFIEENLAIRYSDYYEQWLNYETRRIFDNKEKDNKKYIISSPMFKKYSTRRNKVISSSTKPRFNIEAQPFTPNSSKRQIIMQQSTTPKLNTSFNLDKLHGYWDISTYSNNTENSPSDCCDLSLAMPHSNGRFVALSGDSERGFSTNQRIKQGLEIVSPKSKRKLASPAVSAQSTSINNNKLHNFFPVTKIPNNQTSTVDGQPCPQTIRDFSDYQKRSCSEDSDQHGPDLAVEMYNRANKPVASVSGDNSSEELDSRVPEVTKSLPIIVANESGGHNYNNNSTVDQSSPSKKYPMPIGSFNYPIPFVGSSYAFQPYSFHNMYMFQSSMMKSPFVNDAFINRANNPVTKPVASNVGYVQFIPNENNL